MLVDAPELAVGLIKGLGGDPTLLEELAEPLGSFYVLGNSCVR